jgi:hypothetical protein
VLSQLALLQAVLQAVLLQLVLLPLVQPLRHKRAHQEMALTQATRRVIQPIAQRQRVAKAIKARRLIPHRSHRPAHLI